MPDFTMFLFDLDGTLVDQFAAIHRAHVHTLRELGLPEPTMAQVRAAVGGGLEAAIARLAGPDRVAEALAIYQPYWDATMLDDVTLFAGARELIEALHRAKAKLAVLTNKQGSSARRVCEHLGVAPFFNGIFGAGDTAWLKPRREFTEFVMTSLGADRAGTLLVGDSTYDVETAKNGGLPAWCVTTGTHTAAELAVAGANRVFADLAALGQALGQPIS